MKVQRNQTLLALLLLALTALAAVGGSMNQREPFLEEHDNEDDMPAENGEMENGEMPAENGNGEAPMENGGAPMENGEPPVENGAVGPEGFTGSMYAGF